MYALVNVNPALTSIVSHSYWMALWMAVFEGSVCFDSRLCTWLVDNTHIDFFACFQAISLERSRYRTIVFFFLVALVSLIGRPVACSARIRNSRRQTQLTLAAQARRGLTRDQNTRNTPCGQLGCTL